MNIFASAAGFYGIENVTLKLLINMIGFVILSGFMLLAANMSLNMHNEMITQMYSSIQQ